MPSKYLSSFLITYFLCLPIFCQVLNDSASCCTVHVVKENIVHAAFKNTTSVETLIRSKFNNDLAKVVSFEISIGISKDGLPKNVDFWSQGDRNKYFEILSKKVRKYIIQSFQWKPAYKTVKRKRIYIDGIEHYFIK